MMADWRKWADRSGNPIVGLTERGNRLYGEVEITLDREK